MQSQKVSVLVFTAAWCFSSVYDHPTARLSCLGAMLIALPLTHTQVNLPFGLSISGAAVATLWGAIFLVVWFLYDDELALHAAVFTFNCFMLQLLPEKNPAGPPHKSSSDQNQESVDQYQWLFDFYSKHNPEKANHEQIESTLHKYSGRTDLLKSKLLAKYNVCEQPMSSRQLSHLSQAPPTSSAGTSMFGGGMFGGTEASVDPAVLECLHEYGEVLLKSRSLGQTLEVYMRGEGEFVIRSSNQVIYEAESAEEAHQFLTTVSKIETYRVE